MEQTISRTVAAVRRMLSLPSIAAWAAVVQVAAAGGGGDVWAADNCK